MVPNFPSGHAPRVTRIWILLGAALIVGVAVLLLQPPIPEEPSAPVVQDVSGALQPAPPTARASAPTPVPDPTPVRKPSAVSTIQPPPFAVALAPEQVEAFVTARGGSAPALVTAFHVTGDEAWLEEALKRHPNDPGALTAVALQSGNDELRGRSIDTLRRISPDDALPHYLSSLRQFEGGQADEALDTLMLADSMSRFQSPSFRAWAGIEDCYTFSGRTAVEAQIAAFSHAANLETIDTILSLGRHIAEARERSLAEGDADAARALAESGARLGRRMNEQVERLLIDELAGAALEERFLGMLPPDHSLPGGTTVRERRAAIEALRENAKEFTEAGPAMLNIGEETLGAYLADMKQRGQHHEALHSILPILTPSTGPRPLTMENP